MFVATRNPTGKSFGGLQRQQSSVHDSDDDDEVESKSTTSKSTESQSIETKSVSRSPSPKPMAIALPGLDGTNHLRSLSPVQRTSPKNEENAHNEPTWGRSLSPVRDRSASPPPGVMKKKIVDNKKLN